MRYWSEEIPAGFGTLGAADNPQVIATANTYPANIVITGDKSPWNGGAGQPGKQTNIHVQLQIPGTTPDGSHSASFKVRKAAP
jgi:hypothetical protein